MNQNVWIGGLLGRVASTQVVIRNSSVTNFKLEQNKEIAQITLGGIVGETVSTMQIENCYAQNIDFYISNVGRYNGIGGIVGKTSSTADVIRNCYATGNIEAQGEYIGGIAGKNVGMINNCYSLVNISSTSEYIGGIVGQDTSTSSSETVHFVSNNISIGNIYSRTTNKEYVNRIFGSTNNTIISNYAYTEQLVNGEISNEEQLANLLTREELLQRQAYTDANFDNNWNYDGLSEGILPKLYNTNGGELLPNQEDNKLEKQADIRIESVEASKRDVNHAEIRLVINNLTEENITDIEIDSMDVTIERNVTQEGKTYIDILGTPTGYYDSYKITSVVYEQEDEEKKTQEEKKIELQFFKDIGKIEDWQEIDSTSAQNYRLVADLDFTNVRDPNTNVSIGRLVAEGNGYTIKNLTTTDKNLIKEAKLEIRNITFENINISNNSNYTGIIGENNATLEDLNFKECTIIVNYNNAYIGLISHNTGKTITSINLEDIEFQGGYYLGGFIGSTDEGNFSDIKANNITINTNTTGSYVGGIFGSITVSDNNQETEVRNIEITNSNIIAPTANNVGGIAGWGRTKESKVTDTYVEGVDKVGGMIGGDESFLNTSRNNNICERVTVKGRNQVGGIYGYGYTKGDNLYLINSEVTGSGNQVGGLIGSATHKVGKCGVINSKISGNNQVGGIFGSNTSNAGQVRYFVENSTIEGYDQVGGIEGYRSSGGGMSNIIVNANITAINGSAGGITGYYSNQNSSAASLEVFAWQIAAPSASAASSGFGISLRFSSTRTICCTCFLSACPFPVTASLICIGVYS